MSAARVGIRRRRGVEGFTLIELTVALAAGLIVALGVVSLSKEATRTFHEEVRSSAAEATLRTAVDRLRADLQRAGYMSTGNIVADTRIPHAPGQPNTATVNPGITGIRRLSSIYLQDQGSLTLNALGHPEIDQTPALGPDMIDIAGNMSSSERFDVQLINPTPNGTCTQILLSPVSPAIYRIAAAGLGSAAASQELRNVFAPEPAGLTDQFIVRLTDDTGRSQFLATCPMANVAGFNGTQPFLWVSTADTPILTSAATQTLGGISGFGSGSWVNPVQIVRWEITTSAYEATNLPQYANALDNQSTQYGTVDPAKYDLLRSYLDAKGKVITQTSEVVAEYAVDLKFAFSVDTTIQGALAPNIVTYAFEDPLNRTWAFDVSTQPASPVGPQRIRSVRARIVTRAAQADRTVNVPVANFGAQPFLYRYCTNPTPSCATSDGTLRWARARTVTTEVSLPNQAQDFF